MKKNIALYAAIFVFVFCAGLCSITLYNKYGKKPEFNVQEQVAATESETPMVLPNPDIVVDTNKGIREDETVEEYADRLRTLSPRETGLSEEQLSILEPVEGVEYGVVPKEGFDKMSEAALSILEDEAEKSRQYVKERYNLDVTTYSFLDCQQLEDSDKQTVRCMFDNTHIAFVYVVNVVTGERLNESEPPGVEFGSDYAPIYFTDGMPEDYMWMYKYVLEHEMDWDAYITDYTSGNTAHLVNAITGDEYNIVKE